MDASSADLGFSGKEESGSSCIGGLGFSGKGGLGFSGVGGGPIGIVVFDVEGSGAVVAGVLGGGGPMVFVIGMRAGGHQCLPQFEF